MKKILSASLAGGLLLALAANASAAGAGSEHMDFYRDAMQANAEAVASHQPCVPANGAQILSGVAAPGDLVTQYSGEACGHR